VSCTWVYQRHRARNLCLALSEVALLSLGNQDTLMENLMACQREKWKAKKTVLTMEIRKGSAMVRPTAFWKVEKREMMRERLMGYWREYEMAERKVTLMAERKVTLMVMLKVI